MDLPIKIQLPDNFLLEEERCGYIVTTQMKEVWAVELDLYNELKRVCDKYNIQIVADGGTVLGAIRHSGFIPWDDDMDFSMTRSDYKKLCEIAPVEFKYPYFWQTEETDHGSFRGHGQLRNSETTAIRKEEREYNCKYNQGIFIDVFPLDNVPDDTAARHHYIKRINKLIDMHKLYRDSMAGINRSRGVKKVAKDIMIKYYYSKLKCNYAYEKLEKHKELFCNKETHYFTNFLYVKLDNLDYSVRPKIWYSNVIGVPFENTIVNVPKEYEKYLEKAYGNWKIPVIGRTIHGDTLFDARKSYINYINKI